jgi:uncharacterized membrane protein
VTVEKPTRTLLLLLLFLTFSALVANSKKTTLHGGQPRSWSAEQRKNKNVWQAACPFIRWFAISVNKHTV